MKALSLFVVVVALVATEAQAQSLQGSQASVDRMYRQAVRHDFDFMANSRMVARYVRYGYLVPVRNTADFVMVGVSFPYARPATRLWINRFSAQYHAYCGERLVVTSLVRPKNLQPRNASPRSVHPTGMSVDLRVPPTARCRRYLENSLLEMERSGIIEATRERNPSHYHVAVYSRQYLEYVRRKTRKLNGRG